MSKMQTLLLDTLFLDSYLSDGLLLDTIAAPAPIQRKIERAKNQSDSRTFLINIMIMITRRQG